MSHNQNPSGPSSCTSEGIWPAATTFPGWHFEIKSTGFILRCCFRPVALRSRRVQWKGLELWAPSPPCTSGIQTTISLRCPTICSHQRAPNETLASTQKCLQPPDGFYLLFLRNRQWLNRNSNTIHCFRISFDQCSFTNGQFPEIIFEEWVLC